MSFIHSLIVSVLVFFGWSAPAPAPLPTATTTEQVATATADVLFENEDITIYAPKINGVQTTKEDWSPVKTDTFEGVTLQPTVVPVPPVSSVPPAAEAPQPVLPPVVVQVEVPITVPPAGSSITSPTPTIVMPTFQITPPAEAPQAALDLLGNHTKTLDEMRVFVVSLNPQVAFKKKMQTASKEELVSYLEKNDYMVVENE